jgi:ABC-type glycerol-3-phosphate transport system substrate-binding protein
MSRYQRRSRLSRVLGGSVVAVLSVSLVACGTSRSTSSRGNDREHPVVLNVMADPSWRFLSTAKQQFEKSHPGITVEIHAVPGSSYYTNIVQRLSLRDVPDVTVLETGPGPFATLVEQNLIARTDSVWRTEKLDSVYSPIAKAVFTAPDGHHYAISPDIWWGPQIYYSSNALAQARVTWPKGPNISERVFVEVMTKLKRAGYVPIAIDGTGDVMGFSFVLSSLIESSCGDAAYLNLAMNWQPRVPLVTTWRSSCVTNAFSALLKWSNMGFFGDYPTARSYSVAEGLFETGKAATRLDASWLPNELKYDKYVSPYGWSLLPTIGSTAPKMQLVPQDALVIPAHSQEKGLARDFLALIASRRFESRQAYFDWIGGAPPRTDVNVPSETPAATRLMLSSMPRVGTILSLVYEVPYGAPGGPLTQNLNAVLSRQESIGAATRALDEEVARLRAGG